MRLLWIVFILSPFCSLAQKPLWHAISLEPEVKIQNLETDTLGFIWMNDDHAIYRFNGEEVESKLTFDEEEISSFNHFKNRFLIGTSAGSVILVNPYTLKKTILQDSSILQPVTDMLYIDEDHYACASYGSGIYIVADNKKIILSTDNGLVSNEVYDVTFFNGYYCIATDQGIQLIKVDQNEVTIQTLGMEDGLSDLVVTHLIKHENKLWYTDYDSHIGSIDTELFITNYAFETSSKVNTMTIQDQSIFIGTDNGLQKFENEQFTSQYPYDGQEKIIEAEKDEEGNIWLVNKSGSLIKGNLYFQKLQEEFDEIRTFTKAGDQYIIGNKNGLFVKEHGQYIKLNDVNITHIIQVDNYYLVGTFSQGVMVYNKDLQLIDQIKDWQDIQDQSVLYIYADGNHVYISSLSGVKEFIIKNGKLSPLKSYNDIIGPGYIYTIQEFSGKMYFGTDRKGLVTWDKKSGDVEKHKTFASDEKIGSVFAITQDHQGKVWFTSDQKGVGYFEEGVPTIMNNQTNIADHYTTLVSTTNGNLLAVKGTTIDLIDPITHHVMYFDKELGLNNNISYLNTYHQENEETYFVHGHDIYRYTAALSVKIHPEVVIDKVLVNLSPTLNNNSFTQDENNIEFKYLGSWLTDPSKLTYQYKLEGYHTEWRSTRDNSISFIKLLPGHYNFKVRASENGRFADEPEDSFAFEIKRHFYNLWWVKGIGFIILSIIGWQIIKARESRKKEKLALEKLNIENQFINLKNQLNPHFLFNAFNTLIGLIEEDSDRSVFFIEKMTDFYRNMLEHGKQNTITLTQEKEMLSQYIDILKARFEGQLEISLQIEDATDDNVLPPMTLQLLLENAVKHNVVSSKKPLQVSIIQYKGRIIVRNRKVGLVQNAKGTKTGLENIKRRFELINIRAPEIIETDEVFEVKIYLKRKI